MKAGELPLDPELLPLLRVHSVTCAVTGVDLALGQFGQPELEVGFLLHLDFGDTYAHWRKVLDAGLEMAVERSGGKLTKKDFKLDELSGFSVTSTQQPVFHALVVS